MTIAWPSTPRAPYSDRDVSPQKKARWRSNSSEALLIRRPGLERELTSRAGSAGAAGEQRRSEKGGKRKLEQGLSKSQSQPSPAVRKTVKALKAVTTPQTAAARLKRAALATRQDVADEWWGRHRELWAQVQVDMERVAAVQAKEMEEVARELRESRTRGAGGVRFSKKVLDLIAREAALDSASRRDDKRGDGGKSFSAVELAEEQRALQEELLELHQSVDLASQDRAADQRDKKVPPPILTLRLLPSFHGSLLP